MKTRAESLKAWGQVGHALTVGAAGTTARIPKATIPHPRDAGAQVTFTWPAGQIADYAIESENGGAPLIVREFQDHYEATLDAVRLAAGSIELANRNPTAAMFLGGALLGGAIGSSVSNKRHGMIVGASIGLLFAALVDVGLEDMNKRRGQG
jgi:hypothetical protein